MAICVLQLAVPLCLCLAVAFGRTTYQMPSAAQNQLRSRSQYFQRQKSDTTDIVAGYSRPLAGQVNIFVLYDCVFPHAT